MSFGKTVTEMLKDHSAFKHQ